MACEFCKFYEFNKKSASDFMKKYTDIDMEMKVSLTIDYSRGKELGNITTGESFNLIFCPMCGKRLEDTNNGCK